MKTCEFCCKHQANILYYESIDGRSRHMHLCPSCSESKGFEALDFLDDPALARLLKLRALLEKSVLSEDFEEAARLRDIINCEDRSLNHV